MFDKKGGSGFGAKRFPNSAQFGIVFCVSDCFDLAQFFVAEIVS
jgi:hypothetical protein